MDEWKTFIGQWLQAPHIPQPEVVGYTNARPSWHLQERILDTALLYIIRDGAMHAELPTQQFDLKRHDALWLPPGVKHTFMLAKPAGALRVYHFRFGIPRDVQPPYPHAAALHDAPDLLRVAAECHSDWTNHTDIDRYQLLVADLLLLFQRSLQEQNLNNRKRLNSNQRRVMWTWLQTNHPQLWNSHALATELNYHPAYFARIFKNTFGTQPRTWFVQERLRQAADLLIESSDSIQSIAESVGFDDPFAFSKQFRKRYGEAPSIWRQHHNASRSYDLISLNTNR